MKKKEPRDQRQEFARWYKETGEAGEVYPSQGLLKTPFDNLESWGKTLLSEEELAETLAVRQYLVGMFNQPERLRQLEKVSERPFAAAPEVDSQVMEYALKSGLALSIGDLGAVVMGTDGKRVSRRKLLAHGPFVRLGKWGRIPFASGAMPDVFGAPAALATMAMCHGLASVPRNGVFSEIKRQVDLVKATFAWMEAEGREEWVKLWRRNIMGVVEPEVNPGMLRAKALYQAGVRAFRVYSPEPGRDALEMVGELKRSLGEAIEVFVGQVAGVAQAVKLEAAGADGLYVGIGGGGRCITAVRSGSVVDWPNLLWQMRGKVGIPVIVEGGASDNVGVTLLLGATGIGVSRLAAGGTIESPGGLMYLVGKDGKWFKPYGGEASARTKFLDGKMLPVGVPAFVEGETTKAVKSYVPYARPTVAENLYFLLEDVVLTLVFRGVKTIERLQALDPSPLRRMTHQGFRQQNSH